MGLLQSKSKIFAILVALLALLTWWDFYREKRQGEAESQERKVVDFATEQIQQIEVKNKQGHFTVLRDQKGWTFVSPFKDLADNEKVEDFVGFLSGEHAESVLTGDQLDLSKYHLDLDQINKSGIEFVMTLSNGNQKTLWISDLTNFENHLFAKWKDQNKILLLGTHWRERAEISAMSWREKHIFRGNKASLSEIHLNNIILSNSIEKESSNGVSTQSDRFWRWTGEPTMKLDQQQAMSFLQSIVNVEGEEFFDKLPVDAVPARFEVKLKNEKGLWSRQVYQRKNGDVLIVGKMQLKEADKDSAPDLIAKINKNHLSQWQKFSPLDLRDKKVLPEFRPDQAQKIELITELKTTVMKKQGTQWIVKDSTHMPPLEMVNAVLNSLSQLRVGRFLLKPEQDKSPRFTSKIVISNAEDKVIFELSYGGSFVKNENGIDSIFRFAEVKGFSEKFGILQSEIDGWKLPEFLQGAK